MLSFPLQLQHRVVALEDGMEGISDAVRPLGPLEIDISSDPPDERRWSCSLADGKCLCMSGEGDILFSVGFSVRVFVIGLGVYAVPSCLQLAPLLHTC